MELDIRFCGKKYTCNFEYNTKYEEQSYDNPRGDAGEYYGTFEVFDSIIKETFSAYDSDTYEDIDTALYPELIAYIEYAKVEDINEKRLEEL